MTNPPTSCYHCESMELYVRTVSSAGAYGPQLLQGLGQFLSFPKFEVVVCADCGHCEFFAEESARKNVRTAKGWRRLEQSP